MNEKIYSLWFLKKGSIRNRVFRLILLGSMTILVVMGLLVAYGLYTMDSVFMTQSDQLTVTSAGYIENVTSQQITGRLTDVAQTRALAIETELSGITNDTNYLAYGVESVIKNPEYFAERSLPDPRFQKIRPGEVYIHRGAKLQASGVSPSLRHEIGIMSNALSYIAPMAKQYNQFESSIFIGSKNGYIIAADNAPGKEYINMTEEFLTTYEPTERGWYKNTKERGTITFNDIYVGADGYPSFTCSAPYEDNDGFAGVVAIACSVKSISDILDNSLMGKSGISFVLSDKGKIMLSTNHEGLMNDVDGKDLQKDSSDSLGDAVEKMMSGASGWQIVEMDGQNYFLAYAPMKKLKWSFGTIIAINEVMTPVQTARQHIVDQVGSFKDMMNSQMVKFALVAIISIWSALVMLFNITSWLTNRFVEPIKELTDGVREIAAGNLEKKIAIPTRDELETLANAFNNMTDKLQNYMSNLTRVTMEKEHIATELAVATNIQESMLPHTFPFAPEHTEFDIYATMQAAKEVGGDFYDFYMVDDEHLLVTIADVSGKGVPAALFMVIAKTMLKNSVLSMEGERDLAAIMARTNDQLCQNNDAMMFVTAFMGILNLTTGKFNYINAGHNPPVLYKANENRFDFMPVARNFVMGGMDNIEYKSQELTLCKGDRLVLYTDGVTEALNYSKELFGEERLLDTLNKTTKSENSAQKLLLKLEQVLKNYVGHAEQSDDITMLALVYNGHEMA